MKYPGEFQSIDEGMIPYKCRKAPCERHMPTKPIKCGFKIFMAVEYQTQFLWDFEVDDDSITAANAPPPPAKSEQQPHMKNLPPKPMPSPNPASGTRMLSSRSRKPAGVGLRKRFFSRILSTSRRLGNACSTATMCCSESQIKVARTTSKSQAIAGPGFRSPYSFSVATK